MEGQQQKKIKQDVGKYSSPPYHQKNLTNQRYISKNFEILDLSQDILYSIIIKLPQDSLFVLYQACPQLFNFVQQYEDVAFNLYSLFYSKQEASCIKFYLSDGITLHDEFKNRRNNVFYFDPQQVGCSDDDITEALRIFYQNHTNTFHQNINTQERSLELRIIQKIKIVFQVLVAMQVYHCSTNKESSDLPLPLYLRRYNYVTFVYDIRKKHITVEPITVETGQSFGFKFNLRLQTNIVVVRMQQYNGESQLYLKTYKIIKKPHNQEGFPYKFEVLVNYTNNGLTIEVEALQLKIIDLILVKSNIKDQFLRASTIRQDDLQFIISDQQISYIFSDESYYEVKFDEQVAFFQTALHALGARQEIAIQVNLSKFQIQIAWSNTLQDIITSFYTNYIKAVLANYELSPSEEPLLNYNLQALRVFSDSKYGLLWEFINSSNRQNTQAIIYNPFTGSSFCFIDFEDFFNRTTDSYLDNYLLVGTNLFIIQQYNGMPDITMYYFDIGLIYTKMMDMGNISIVDQGFLSSLKEYQHIGAYKKKYDSEYLLDQIHQHKNFQTGQFLMGYRLCEQPNYRNSISIIPCKQNLLQPVQVQVKGKFNQWIKLSLYWTHYTDGLWDDIEKIMKSPDVNVTN